MAIILNKNAYYELWAVCPLVKITNLSQKTGECFPSSTFGHFDLFCWSKYTPFKICRWRASNSGLESWSKCSTSNLKFIIREGYERKIGANYLKGAIKTLQIPIWLNNMIIQDLLSNYLRMNKCKFYNLKVVLCIAFQIPSG